MIQLLLESTFHLYDYHRHEIATDIYHLIYKDEHMLSALVFLEQQEA